MEKIPKYPQDYEIKVVWTKFIIGLLFVSTFALWSVFFYMNQNIFEIKPGKFISVLGLYTDMLGVAIASLRTPYYGAFHDGGALEVKRSKKEEGYFKIGMLFIGIGFFLQGLGSII